MTPDSIDLYRRLIQTHRLNRDPLIMVKTEELALLLDSFEWYANPQKKPKVRVKAEPAQ